MYRAKQRGGAVQGGVLGCVAGFVRVGVCFWFVLLLWCKCTPNENRQRKNLIRFL